MTDIVNKFAVGPDDVQFGAVTFSSSARIEFDLQQHADKESVVADIKSWIRVRKYGLVDDRYHFTIKQLEYNSSLESPVIYILSHIRVIVFHMYTRDYIIVEACIYSWNFVH